MIGNRKRGQKFLTIFLYFLFSIFFIFFLVKRVYAIAHSNTQVQSNDFIRNEEEFEPSLSRLDNLSKVADYCDSLYKVNGKTRTYPGLVSEVLRKKFYHGYSYYNFFENPVGVLLGPIVRNGATAIVLPDDITKYPNAACSQQSIVAMEILKSRGFQTRKVAMFDTINNSGHFAYEAFFDSSWHFYDADQEPDYKILMKYNRPSSAFLAANPEITLEAYRTKKDPELFKRLLMASQTGPINNFPAPNARFYQLATLFMSDFGWLFIGVVILLRYLIISGKKNPAKTKHKNLKFSRQASLSN